MNKNSIQQKQMQGTWVDLPLSLTGILFLLPVYTLNILVAILMDKEVFQTIHTKDAIGRRIKLRRFSCGPLKSSAVLIDVLQRRVALCGIPLGIEFDRSESLEIMARYRAPAGLISDYQVCLYTGFGFGSVARLTQNQLHKNTKEYLSLIAKFVFCVVFYKPQVQVLPEKISLFGLSIDNLSMADAIAKTVTKADKETPNKIYFVNAHSVNESAKTAHLKSVLDKATYLFADGSGMRVAAHRMGTTIKENVNGTDMLPHLCKAAQKKSLKLYLLGAKPGVAEKTAQNLEASYPGLEISGYRDGYFSDDQSERVVRDINQSGADIVLVALGSPRQESWIEAHADKLNCTSVLAVGGLFDFYSGNIARAPESMRQLGLEWIWRLMQEPKTKFKRYVVGTPEFLFRVYFLNQVRNGV